MLDAAVAAIRGGHNQYPPGPGIPELRAAIARHQARFYGLEHDPETEVLVTAGATEAVAAPVIEGPLKVAAVQHDIAWEDRDATFARLAPLLAEAAAGGARLAVLSELFAVGFTMATDRVAEPPHGPTVRFLYEQATTHGMWVCGSVPVVGDDGEERPFNQFVVASPDGGFDRYEKLHPFTYGGETLHYRPGDRRVTFDVEGVRLTPFVCYDLRFGDEWWPMATSTDCYVVVANWPATRRHHWRTLLAARAIENQAFVVGVNRVGSGGGLDYAGDSMVVDPMGDVLVDGEGGEERVLLADIDPKRVGYVRQQFPFLADRRDGLTQ